MTASDIVKSLQDENVPEARAMELLSLFGAGLQTYDENRNRPKEVMR